MRKGQNLHGKVVGQRRDDVHSDEISSDITT
jgi:hypothetical protein